MKALRGIDILNFALALGLSSVALADQFNVDEMPPGAEITLPGAATTMAPIAAKLKLASTDAPQTVSIVPVALPGARAVPVMVSIYDSKQDRVKYVQISPGSPFLYSFKGLSEITVATDLPPTSAASKQSVRLKLESDKPLTITRSGGAAKL